MASSAMHLQCVKGAVNTTWRVEGLIWDMLEDVGAETRPRSLSFLRTFLFSNHAVRANRSQTSVRTAVIYDYASYRCVGGIGLEPGDHPSNIQSLSVGDFFRHFPLCPCRYVLPSSLLKTAPTSYHPVMFQIFQSHYSYLKQVYL